MGQFFFYTLCDSVFGSTRLTLGKIRFCIAKMSLDSLRLISEIHGPKNPENDSNSLEDPDIFESRPTKKNHLCFPTPRFALLASLCLAKLLVSDPQTSIRQGSNYQGTKRPFFLSISFLG